MTRTITRKYFLCAVIILSLATLSGCKTVTATPTPGVSSFYSQAALVMNDFSGVLVQAQNLFTTAHADGLVDDAQYAAGQQVFGQVAVSGEAIVTLIKAGASQGSIVAQINALVAEIGSMPSSFGIKNPQTQAEFTALTSAMQGVLQSAMQLVQTSSTAPLTTAPVAMGAK